MTEAEVLRVLARIARTGKPVDRLRAAELLGRQLGMFRDQAQAGRIEGSRWKIWCPGAVPWERA